MQSLTQKFKLSQQHESGIKQIQQHESFVGIGEGVVVGGI